MKNTTDISLIGYFSVLPDPRKTNHSQIRHELLDIIVIAILAVICGADTWMEIAEFGRAKESWLKEFLSLPNGIPSHDTFGRVFSLLDPEAFEGCFFAWVKTVQKRTKGEVIAIDGKSARRAHAREGKPLHLVNAFATVNGIVLGQRKVDDKSNEITAIPELLDVLMLKGCIVTIDAMSCQGWIVKKIVENKGDYVLAVKGNQERLLHDISQVFAETESALGNYSKTSEHIHGREETRECWAAQSADCIRGHEKWDNLRSVALIKHTRTVNGSTAVESRYFISSLAPNASAILSAVRAHWKVENTLHWSLDVSFREDESRIRIGHAQQNLALVRKLALNLLRKEKTATGGIKAKRMKAAWNHDYFLSLLGITP